MGMTQRYEHVGAPHLLHSLLEWRALLEMASLPLAWPVLNNMAPEGDGHPVLLLPGFMAEEGTLVALRLFLQGRGYDVQAWGLGRNIGFQRRHADALEQKIRHLHHTRPGAPCQSGGLEPGRRVRACTARTRRTECVRRRHHAGQPGERRRLKAASSPAPGEGHVPHRGAPRWGPTRTCHAAAREEGA